ncbi:hypothetical protein LUZ63_005834 [Rhynchospora breviuscula]|uniref:FAF domain-containing protein n=1 Tax=Rhynchospora breviuscula TaxID=2022672 RepID=A0A9Q0CNM7_9POAL|nr:hypothetical protein LUZ63_005834 [Rhynchospora breviuscula]
MPPLNQVDVWAAIQSEIDSSPPKITKEVLSPYVHPLTRRSSLMSQKSLEICTESLGSETGSEFSSDESNYFSSDSDSDESEFETFSNKKRLINKDSKKSSSMVESKDLVAVNYHCSGGNGGGRTFPPPLPSIARRDGQPCVRMQQHRQDGRLVVQAVPVRSNTYLHANRHEGRLRLCFIDCSSRAGATETTTKQVVSPASNVKVPQQEVEKVVVEEEEEGEVEVEAEEELEGEEEVEVVERRTVIEVKVGSKQNVRVHRSSLVINKFLGSTPDAVLATETTALPPMRPPSPPKRLAAATAATSAAAAVVAAASSSVTDNKEMAYGSYGYNGGDTKLLYFTSRRSNKEELLSSMRRCSELRRPLFIWEPCCIASS